VDKKCVFVNSALKIQCQKYTYSWVYPVSTGP